MQYDSFDEAIHYIYDDCNLKDNIENSINTIIFSNEIPYFQKLIKNLDFIFNKYGTQYTDKQYIDLPEWQNILESAKST